MSVIVMIGGPDRFRVVRERAVMRDRLLMGVFSQLVVRVPMRHSKRRRRQRRGETGDKHENRAHSALTHSF